MTIMSREKYTKIYYFFLDIYFKIMYYIFITIKGGFKMETRARKRSNIYKGSISYSNLWDTLERRGLKRSNLLDKESFNLSPALVNKLRHDRNVNIDTIMYLCEKLDCQVCDIVEYKK